MEKYKLSVLFTNYDPDHSDIHERINDNLDMLCSRHEITVERSSLDIVSIPTSGRYGVVGKLTVPILPGHKHPANIRISGIHFDGSTITDGRYERFIVGRYITAAQTVLQTQRNLKNGLQVTSVFKKKLEEIHANLPVNDVISQEYRDSVWEITQLAYPDIIHHLYRGEVFIDHVNNNETLNVYVKGSKIPFMNLYGFRAKAYHDLRTKEHLKSMEDVKGGVVDIRTMQIVLSEDDFKKGIYMDKSHLASIRITV